MTGVYKVFPPGEENQVGNKEGKREGENPEVRL